MRGAQWPSRMRKISEVFWNLFQITALDFYNRLGGAIEITAFGMM